MIGILRLLLLACAAAGVQSLEITADNKNTVRDKNLHDNFSIDDGDHFDLTPQKIVKGITDEGRVDPGADLSVSDLPNVSSLLPMDQSLPMQEVRKYVEEFQEVETNYTFCNDIQFIMGTEKNDKTGGFNDINLFTCMMMTEESRTTSSRYVELSNLPSTFESEWIVARKLGKTSIAIFGETTLDGHTLILPDNTLGKVYRFLHPAPSSAATSKNARTRNLAINQFGSRSVIVFRVSINFESATYNPLKDAIATSDIMFGSGFSFKSQYEACSYGKLEFEPATNPGEADAQGVISITVNPTSMLYEDVRDAVDLKAEESILNNGLGLNLDDYDHIMYDMPQGVIYKGGTNWVAFAFTVWSFINVMYMNVIISAV